ncbi:MAG TPA: adenylate/guanylate cyclase domain-containing protein [Actinomycetota bacterium]|nr:adenylate/guanylate cyclase domain-containing protein [Actinomycetota bacterium]
MGKSRIVPEEEWRAYLEGTHAGLHRAHRALGWLPSDPRCRLCSIPFAGAGRVLGRMSKANRPWVKNPNLCSRCVVGMSRDEIVGAEVAVSFLFADVRGSSDLARRLGDRDFTQVMRRFYTIATQTLFDHDAILDKFVGDEVVGFFLPFMAGPEHPRRAVDAARALLREAGYGTEAGPWLPIGAAVHTGPSFVGFVPRGLDSEFTALGNTVNVAAHLAAQAKAGEILITEEVRAALRADGLDRRHLSLKGHELDAFVIPAETTAHLS